MRLFGSLLRKMSIVLLVISTNWSIPIAPCVSGGNQPSTLVAPSNSGPTILMGLGGAEGTAGASTAVAPGPVPRVTGPPRLPDAARRPTEGNARGPLSALFCARYSAVGIVGRNGFMRVP